MAVFLALTDSKIPARPNWWKISWFYSQNVNGSLHVKTFHAKSAANNTGLKLVIERKVLPETLELEFNRVWKSSFGKNRIKYKQVMILVMWEEEGMTTGNVMQLD